MSKKMTPLQKLESMSIARDSLDDAIAIVAYSIKRHETDEQIEAAVEFVSGQLKCVQSAVLSVLEH